MLHPILTAICSDGHSFHGLNSWWSRPSPSARRGWMCCSWGIYKSPCVEGLWKHSKVAKLWLALRHSLWEPAQKCCVSQSFHWMLIIYDQIPPSMTAIFGWNKTNITCRQPMSHKTLANLGNCMELHIWLPTKSPLEATIDRTKNRCLGPNETSSWNLQVSWTTNWLALFLGCFEPVLDRCWPLIFPTHPPRRETRYEEVLEHGESHLDLQGWVSNSATSKNRSDWWFQPLWKRIVSWDHYSQYMEKMFQTSNQRYNVGKNNAINGPSTNHHFYRDFKHSQSWVVYDIALPTLIIANLAEFN